MGRPAILEERIVRVLMPDGVELRKLQRGSRTVILSYAAVFD
jgi:hypothetical protein